MPLLFTENAANSSLTVRLETGDGAGSGHRYANTSSAVNSYSKAFESEFRELSHPARHQVQDLARASPGFRVASIRPAIELVVHGHQIRDREQAQA